MSGFMEIPLTRGFFALVDEDDYVRVLATKWWAQTRCGKTTYARGEINGVSVALHRFIMNAPPRIITDHINGNGLDCRKANLRLCTAFQSSCNRKGWSSLGIKGVDPCASGRFRARIRINGREVSLGAYNTKEEAARVYDAAALKHYGTFARLNFPLTHQGAP